MKRRGAPLIRGGGSYMRLYGTGHKLPNAEWANTMLMQRRFAKDRSHIKARMITKSLQIMSGFSPTSFNLRTQSVKSRSQVDPTSIKNIPNWVSDPRFRNLRDVLAPKEFPRSIYGRFGDVVGIHFENIAPITIRRWVIAFL